MHVRIWLAFVAAHFTIGAWGWVAGGDRLAAIVAGSIYLPLWPIDKLGLPVFRQTGWIFPPPTPLGWAIIVAFWLIAYWCIAALVVWLRARRRDAL
jgi:hypothetical protein